MDSRAVILLSRQPLRPTKKTVWVRKTIEAMRWVKKSSYTLCSSCGMQTWELVTALASLKNVPLRIFIPARERQVFDSLCDRVKYDFNLTDGTADFIPVLPVDCSSKVGLLLARDEAIVNEAGLLIPVSVRAGGQMDTLMASSSKDICTDFRTNYLSKGSRLAYELHDLSLNPQLQKIGESLLIHWTRSVNSPWPGERKLDYYLDVLSYAQWPRSAFETLQRILRMKRIIASARHMPANIRTVSFSALSPINVIPLMRWRARYSQMSFEPYGFGIDKAWAESIGLRPVHYHAGSAHSKLTDVPRWLQQSTGRLTDWRDEKEHRHRGDLELEAIPPEKIVLFCCHKYEAITLRERFGFRAIPFLP